MTVLDFSLRLTITTNETIIGRRLRGALNMLKRERETKATCGDRTWSGCVLTYTANVTMVTCKQMQLRYTEIAEQKHKEITSVIRSLISIRLQSSPMRNLLQKSINWKDKLKILIYSGRQIPISLMKNSAKKYGIPLNEICSKFLWGTTFSTNDVLAKAVEKEYQHIHCNIGSMHGYPK